MLSLLISTIFFFAVKYIQNKTIFSINFFFIICDFWGVHPVYSSLKILLSLSIMGSTTYQIVFSSVKQFLSYGPTDRQTQTDRETDENEIPYFSEFT